MPGAQTCGFAWILTVFSVIIHSDTSILAEDTSLKIDGYASGGSQDFQAGETLELTCTATFSINWKWPNNSVSPVSRLCTV